MKKISFETVRQLLVKTVKRPFIFDNEVYSMNITVLKRGNIHHPEVKEYLGFYKNEFLDSKEQKVGVGVIRKVFTEVLPEENTLTSQVSDVINSMTTIAYQRQQFQTMVKPIIAKLAWEFYIKQVDELEIGEFLACLFLYNSIREHVILQAIDWLELGQVSLHNFAFQLLYDLPKKDGEAALFVIWQFQE